MEAKSRNEGSFPRKMPRPLPPLPRLTSEELPKAAFSITAGGSSCTDFKKGDKTLNLNHCLHPLKVNNNLCLTEEQGINNVGAAAQKCTKRNYLGSIHNGKNTASGDMISWWSKRKLRRRAIAALVCLACFVLGVTVPLLMREIFGRSKADDSFVMPVHHPRGRLLAQSFYLKNRLSVGHKGRGDFSSVLKDVYISVKTTKKFHHPRLVILLETWVDLVKAQV